MRGKYFYVLTFLLAISGCTYSRENKPAPTPSPTPLVTETAITLSAPLIEDYTAYYDIDDYKPALYEQSQGCYLGAYVLANKMINYDMREFERKTEKSHLIYSYHMKLGDAFPLNWLLDCTAQMKTPLIVVNPIDMDNPFTFEQIKSLAQELGNFYVPLFVQLYPSPAKNNMPVKEYKEFFKSAYSVFKEYAPNCAILFGINGSNSVEDMQYYPGDDYTDWIGISMYEAINADGNHGDDFFSNLDSVYYTYQKSKPIMLSQLAVSHYSTRDHVYYTNQASNEITNIYSRIAVDYPAVKAVIYMDFNNLELSSSGIRDNFSITDNKDVLSAYSNAIADENYISRLSDKQEPQSRRIKSPFPIKKMGDQLYISENSLIFDMNKAPQPYWQPSNINGASYYSLEYLKEKNILDFGFDKTTGKLLLKIK